MATLAKEEHLFLLTIPSFLDKRPHTSGFLISFFFAYPYSRVQRVAPTVLAVMLPDVRTLEQE